MLPFPVNRTLQPRFSPKSRCFCLLSPSCFFATFNVLTFQRANAVCAPYPRYLGSPTSGYGARVLISPTSLHPYVIASIFGTLFHFPYLLSPLFATLTKTAGVYAISSRFGDPPVAHSSSTLPLVSFQSLTDCKFCNSRLLIFIQNAGGCTPLLPPGPRLNSAMRGTGTETRRQRRETTRPSFGLSIRLRGGTRARYW